MTKLTYDQLLPGKRYRATMEVAPNRTGGHDFPSWHTATYEEIPEPPKPLAVGDEALWKTSRGTIEHIIDQRAWVVFDDGSDSVIALSDLTRIEGEG